MLQNSKENTQFRLSFLIKLNDYKLQLYYKEGQKKLSPANLAKGFKIYFLWNTFRELILKFRYSERNIM